MRHHLVTAALIATFAGCASDPATQSTSNGAPSSSAAPSMAPRASTSGSAATAPSSAASAAGRETANAAAPQQRSVFFDYDSNVVKDEYTPVVRSNAQYLQRRASRVTIEGNTDERGSREYNLALGQRRADAVKQRLTLLGVPAQQIETVSFGEEKPRADGEAEQALAQNRRADIVYGR